MASLSHIYFRAVAQSTRTARRWSSAAIAAAACALSCGAPASPGLRGAGSSAATSADFPPFPSGEPPPPLPEIAALLVRGLPEPDRAAATRLLTDDILSRDLRDLPRVASAQPSALAIVRAAYHTLVRVLRPLAVEQRLARLATIACTRRGDRVTRRATALAVARYVADRGRPRTILVVGYLDEAGPYLALTPDQLEREAVRTEQQVSAYEQDAQGNAACFAQQEPLLADARRALDAARAGTFDPAAGAFYVFLRNAGERPQRLAPR